MTLQALDTQEVEYDDSLHRYFLGAVPYISSTQLVERFKNPFDAHKWSLWMVYKYGCTQAYWLQRWDTIRDKSLARGKEIHTAKEEYLYRRGVQTSSGRVLRVHRTNGDYTHWHTPFLNFPDGIYPELKLWNHAHRIAGRADKVILTTLYPEYSRVADVEDYKTGETIDREAYRDTDTGKPIMMKYPLQHMQDCDLVHYALQLSIYQYMLECRGFKPGYRHIIHEQHEIEGLGVPEPKVIPVPYLRAEVISMLQHLGLTA